MRDTVSLEIRNLGPKELITEPGFYNIPMERHHGQPCDGVSVTSSVLRTMEMQTPADVWAFHQLNPDRWERKTTDALRMGKAMAALIEGGPEELENVVRVLPANKPNRPMAAQVAAYKAGKGTEAGIRSVEFWAKIDADPRDIITEAQWQLIIDMGKVLAQDPAASAALGGHPEITMAFYDEANDLWCLSRPDQVSFDGLISDYKKINTQGHPFNHRLVDRRITSYGYDMQIAFADEAFHALTGEHPDQAGLVFQHDERPHHVILRAIERDDLDLATLRNKRARRLFRECLDSGNWWGPGEDIGAYQRPQWQREMLLEQFELEGAA